MCEEGCSAGDDLEVRIWMEINTAARSVTQQRPAALRYGLWGRFSALARKTQVRSTSAGQSRSGIAKPLMPPTGAGAALFPATLNFTVAPAPTKPSVLTTEEDNQIV
jgi:hypothetical protein